MPSTGIKRPSAQQVGRNTLRKRLDVLERSKLPLQTVLEQLELDYGITLSGAEARRNIVTQGIFLNDLVGKRFQIGAVVCEGIRLCHPCKLLEKLTGKQVLRPLVDRGGLRADILNNGTIRVGDSIMVVD